MSLVNLPHKYGKPLPEHWLGRNRVKKQTISSFSSIVLNLVPMLFLFLDKYCSNDPELVDVVRMYYVFHIILGVLSTGPDDAPRHTDKLRRLIVEFHSLFARLSNSFKPKLHQMHHLIDGIEWLGKSLSCFVTERKHRVIKDCALHVFRHIEHTVLADVINKQCHQFAEGVDLFKEQFLHKPRTVSGVDGLLRSAAAMLRCGMVRSGDIVWFRDATCGRVVYFIEIGDSIYIFVALYANIEGDPSRLDESRQSRHFIDAHSMVDACTWYYANPAEIKIVIPPIVLI